MPKTKKKPEFVKHPDAIAWEEWLKDNWRLTDSSLLGAPRPRNEYLENRLAVAWQAGVEYGRKAGADPAGSGR